MFFRFCAAVVLIVAVSLLGIALEKRVLSLKRAVSLQTYRAAQLEERGVQLRLRCEQLGAPARLLEKLAEDPAADSQPTVHLPAHPAR